MDVLGIGGDHVGLDKHVAPGREAQFLDAFLDYPADLVKIVIIAAAYDDFSFSRLFFHRINIRIRALSGNEKIAKIGEGCCIMAAAYGRGDFYFFFFE